MWEGHSLYTFFLSVEKIFDLSTYYTIELELGFNYYECSMRYPL